MVYDNECETSITVNGTCTSSTTGLYRLELKNELTLIVIHPHQENSNIFSKNLHKLFE